MDIEETNAELISVKRAAARLGVSARTVWRIIADGQLKVVHIRGCTRVHRWSVDEYLKQSERGVCV